MDSEVFAIYDGLNFRQEEIDGRYWTEIYDDKQFAISEFEIIEEQQDIDIQDIEELEYETVIETLGTPDSFQGNEAYCLKTLSKNDENLIKSNAENHKKINELIQAVKQLDRKIREEK